MDPLLRLWCWCAAATHQRDDRGDVPGWVLVTVMSVGLVTALLTFARPALVGMLRNALSSVQ
ncbi:hypothetical protein [Nocardioides antri]|uniref:DUF4244 domain-containing protein n=1 Tax=Nocardioides antri TaxID=2607659 RepID=A0A5B1LUG1_9ACTN|nr:hypothetical protein [Nocardioides antri]KAA1424303.1 hypothetical protein F0U47_18890 [Nocardioides antri]